MRIYAHTRLAALLKERDRIDDQRARAICPDCGTALLRGEILCAQCWQRLSGPERRLFGGYLAAAGVRR